MADKLCIDLCSGLGGFSAAFRDAGWEVVTVDIEPKFKPTIVGDICELVETWSPPKRPDILLASPPCTNFSFAHWQWPLKGTMKAMQVVGACFEAVVKWKPRYWMIENPRARLSSLAPFPPTLNIFYSEWDSNAPSPKPTSLWTNIPLGLIKHQRARNAPTLESVYNRWSGRIAEKVALVPYGLSQAVLEAVSAPEPEERSA